MKRFNIVVPRDDGGVEVFPMKQWLREHPHFVPSGLDPTSSTSHQLRDGLRRAGWPVQESESEVRIVRPDTVDLLTQIDAVLGDGDEDETPVSEAAFALERHLRDFIAANLDSLAVPGSKLKLYVDPTGRDGIEYPTDVGPIDILAVDEGGNFFVFELKVDRGADKAVGQLARYLTWVRRTIGKERQVSGIIVAKRIEKKLRYAAQAVQGTQLFEYEVDFQLRPANDLPE
jgi:RecB family endonuclease NucS